MIGRWLFFSVCVIHEHMALAQPGTLDPTFDGDGKVTTDFGAATYDAARAVRVRPDGTVLAAGTSGYSGTQDFALARYLGNGTLDPGFGAGGVRVLSVGPEDDIATCMALPGDTAIVVGGYRLDAGYFGFAMARFHSDGSPDLSFGTSGVVATQFPGDATTQASAIALQSSGKILLAGGGANGMAVVRYHPDGAVDSTFGAGGLVTIDLSQGNDAVTGMAVLPDDRILLAGYASGLSSDSIALARLDVNGALDGSFAGGGAFRTSYPTLPSLALGLARMTDGRFAITGTAGTMAFVGRFLEDGQPDPDFNGFGMKLITVPGSSSEVCHGIAVRDDGRIVVAGRAALITSDVLVAQLNDDGSMDGSFGTAGIVTTNYFGTADMAYGVSVQPDGAVVIAGSTNGGATDLDLALARYQDPLTTTMMEHARVEAGLRAFPVPFADRITIEFEQDGDGPVWIDLLDARGAEVAQLLDGSIRAKGTHRCSFPIDASLAPGAYALRMRSASGVRTIALLH